MSSMKIWKPWLKETINIINTSAKWLFAALILNSLLLANIGLILFVINQMSQLIGDISK